MIIRPSIFTQFFQIISCIILFIAITYWIPTFVLLTSSALYWPCFIFASLFLLRPIWLIADVYSTTYDLSDDKLFTSSGVINRKHENLELFRVKDISISQPLTLRIFRIAHIYIYSSDKSTPILLLKGISDFKAFNDTLRDRVKHARHVNGVREFD